MLFADLKGSTELICDLDPEAAQQLLDPALQRMMDAVHRFDGEPGAGRQGRLGHSPPEPWAWGEAYMRNAVGRLERLLAEATLL